MTRQTAPRRSASGADTIAAEASPCRLHLVAPQLHTSTPAIEPPAEQRGAHRLRVVPSARGTVSVVALHPLDDDEAVLTLTLPTEHFDAGRVRAAMEQAIAALGITSPAAVTSIGPRLMQ